MVAPGNRCPDQRYYGLQSAIEPPIGADTGDKAVVDPEEISRVSLRPEVGNPRVVVEEQEITFDLETEVRGHTPLHAKTSHASDRIEVPASPAVVAGVVEVGVQEGEAGRDEEQ